MAATMGHWEDLMDLESDPYVTPTSTVAHTSPSSATSWVDVPEYSNLVDTKLSSGHVAAADTNETMVPSHSIVDAQDAEDLSESEDEDEKAANDSKMPRVSERRKAQNMKFSTWIAQRANKITKEQVKKAVESTDDDLLSVRNLYAKQESSAIIQHPRDYQLELYEKAKQQNIIAVLDTGSGKTLIAVMLLKHIIDQELEDRALNRQPRISFFLVDCVTLVFQQYAVLRCNLDQNMEPFCGEMGCDLWDKKIWKKHFENNMVIVCTAEVLYKCLMHSFIALDQINLLIFDEAHHAKKNHVYARIIKDFYVPQTDLTKRPKIFGMTASPVDAKQDVVEAAKLVDPIENAVLILTTIRELEAMLDCQIATTADLSLLRTSISRPNEQCVTYDRPCAPYLTPLGIQMKEIIGDLEAVQKVLAFAKDATSQLGEWCADRVWSLALKDKEARKIERTTEKNFMAAQDARPVEQLDNDLERIRRAQDVIEKKIPSKPSSSLGTNSMSSKAKVLLRYLDLIFEKPCETRCIVFVRKRYTAKLLAELFSEISNPNVRLGLLIGTRQGDAGDVKVSFRQQVLTLKKFREGRINTLFATSIAEEGLDIPDCNIIIRFDLYDTMIQYIQSRGRARHANSKYLHMMEADNRMHVQALRDVRSGEAVMRRFCESLPADRLLQGNDCDLDTALGNEESLSRLVVEGTKATLTYSSSLVILAHFVSCLERPEGATLQPTYVMTVANKKFVCEVILPEVARVESAIGRPSTKKAIAKRSAAFEMCKILLQDGLLDRNLIPTIQRILPEMRNAHLALTSNKTTKHSMKIKPCLWEVSRGAFPTRLYLTVFAVVEPEIFGQTSQPLALVTRTLLPDLPSLLLHLPAGKSPRVSITSIRKSLGVTESMIKKLNDFTLCIYKDLFNKTYEDNIPNMSYWLAPIVKDAPIKQYSDDSDSLIDWPVVDFVHLHNMGNPILWTKQIPHSDLSQCFLVDRYDGGKRFFSEKVIPAMRPSDPVPPWAPELKAERMNNIADYSNSRWKASKAKYKMDPDQPVVSVQLAPLRRNFLDEIKPNDQNLPRCYICPEHMIISSLPLPVASMGYLLPSIFTRIESHLITLEACDMLGLTVRPDLALEAMTKDSVNTEEHRNEQIHLQRGMGKNYERLEFIGDAFLKMATSISVFCLFPDKNEFDYHVTRMEMICNLNLLKVALGRELQAYIRTLGFDRHNWLPQGITLLAGTGFNKPEEQRFNKQHNLGEKTIADVCEALIGAALLSYPGTQDMDMAVKAVSVMVSREYHNVTKWSEYWPLYTKPDWQLARATASQLDLATKTEREHNYHFVYPRLLRCAFQHPSYAFQYEKLPSYQRLEFLGDALLDMACINFLFHRHPDRDPQWLTEHKMAMVSNKFLAALAVKLGFHRHLRCSSPIVEASVRQFVTDIEDVEREANGARDYWTTARNPPKCLSDIVESFIGAVFVDSEFDYQQVERFFEEHVRWFFEDMDIYDTFANNHPVTHLHNLLTLSFGCTNYRVMANELPSVDGSPPRNVAVVMIHDDIVADGEASSGKNAKVKACLEANAILDGIAPYQYRMQYRCDCEAANMEKDGINMADIGTNI